MTFLSAYFETSWRWLWRQNKTIYVKETNLVSIAKLEYILVGLSQKSNYDINNMTSK